MAYDFLGLVNDVNGRVNEPKLDESNFVNAGGYYSSAKEAVNSSLRAINQQEYEWPFNHTQVEEILVPGQVRYSFEPDAKTVDFESFRIKRNNDFGNDTRPLKRMDYEVYLQHYNDSEYNADTTVRRLPTLVFQTQDMNYGIYPPPDKPYELHYEYFSLPVDLELPTDVPSVPEPFRHVIVDGAMYYVYHFRGDIDTADRMHQKFKEGVDNLRKIYINRYTRMRDGRVFHGGYRNAV